MAITTTSEYKSYAGITSSAFDTQIGTLLAVAQEMIEDACGRPAGGFESATWTQDVNGFGTELIFVPCWPVSSITSISYIDDSGGLTALDSTSYRAGDGGLLTRTGVSRGRVTGDPFATVLDQTPYEVSPQFSEGKKNYRVVYSGGYGTIPQRLKMAVWRLTDTMRANIGQDPTITGESIGDYSYTKDPAAKTAITEEVYSQIGTWRTCT